MPVNEKQRIVLQIIRERACEFVIGVDEVGYGACAGPITVCVAVARKGWGHPEVHDSKQVPRDVRARLVREVLLPVHGVDHILRSHDNKVIDQMGVVQARDDLVRQLVTTAVEVYPSSIVVMDGDVLPDGMPSGAVCLPKADDLVAAVSAASIIAKEHRDAFMRELAKQYPGYDFQHNVGYGTPKHMKGLDQHGPCSIHRMSYRNVAYFAERKHMKIGQVSGWAH